MVHFCFRYSSAHMPLGSLFFSILLLLLTSSMEMTFSDARRLPLRRLLELGTIKGQEEAAEIMGETERRRSLIGSRPPRCERLCMSCGHCEAVQVPIAPLEHHKRAHREQVLTAMFSYRVNGIANYKPLSWKCKCGGAILDP